MPDTTAPVVAAVVPGEAATGVDPGAVIRVAFNEEIDAASAAQALRVSSHGIAVAGTLSVSDATLTFTPASPLRDGRTFDVELGTSVTNSAGLPLAAVKTWQFVTRPTPAGSFIQRVVLPGGSNDWSGPFYTSAARYQMLAMASHIRSSGKIRAVGFSRLAATEEVTCTGVTVRLGHTNRTDISSMQTTFASNLDQDRGTSEVVLENGTVVIPAGQADAYFEVPFTSSFQFNGEDNLVIDVTSTACTHPVELHAHMISATATAGENRLIWVFDGASATGNTWPSVADMELHFESGAKGVVAPPGSGITGTDIPFNTGGGRTHALYRAPELRGRGRITGLGMYLGSSLSAEALTTVTVRLAHTTAEAVTTNLEANFTEQPTTVTNARALRLPSGFPARSLFWLPLDDIPFEYDGIRNLLVEYVIPKNLSFISISQQSPGGSALSQAYVDEGGGSSVLVSRPELQLRFGEPAADVVLTNGASSSGEPALFEQSGRRQFLYLASELGGPREITALSVRAGGAFAPVSVGGLQLSLSHTDRRILATSFAANAPSPQVVYDGAFSIDPPGLAGDWIRLPLQRPFLYNGRDNLVLGLRLAQGDELPTILAQTDTAISPARRADRVLRADGLTAESGTLAPEVLLLRLESR